jgi:pimeloyl-ACP methyl ester carboxylesterase
MSLKKMILLGAPSDLEVLINNFCLLLSLNRRLKKYLTTEFEKQLDFSVVNFTAINFAAKIKTPVMVVHDRSDRIVSFDESQKIIKHWKYMTFIETEKLGHSLHDDQLYQKICNYITI